MKLSKGFTLVELLAVIVILALLLTIAVPNVISLSKKIRNNMFCTKVDNIEIASKLYGDDNLDGFIDGQMELYVSDLIDNNVFKKEDKNCVLRNSSNPCVKDPRNNAMMDTDKIILKKQDKQITAEYQYKNNEDKDYCKNR